MVEVTIWLKPFWLKPFSLRPGVAPLRACCSPFRLARWSCDGVRRPLVEADGVLRGGCAHRGVLHHAPASTSRVAPAAVLRIRGRPLRRRARRCSHVEAFFVIFVFREFEGASCSASGGARWGTCLWRLGSSSWSSSSMTLTLWHCCSLYVTGLLILLLGVVARVVSLVLSSEAARCPVSFACECKNGY